MKLFNLVLISAMLTLSVGCASSQRSAEQEERDFEPDQTSAVIFDGETGSPITWNQLQQRIDMAEVIFLGEEHDDTGGHAMQQNIYRAALERHSNQPARPAISLEMLERHEQPLVEAYMQGEIDQPTFLAETGSASWGGDEGRFFTRWYQPTIDAARSFNARVIAANAPRDYVKMSREEGYDAIESLPADERQLVELPHDSSFGGTYQQRFNDLMIESMGGDSKSADASNPHASMSNEMLESFYRAQLVWDATMADSIADALAHPDVSQVFHLLGHFHSDHDGGTVLELRQRLPEVEILTISLRPMRGQPLAGALLDDDRGRAGVVIYTTAADK